MYSANEILILQRTLAQRWTRIRRFYNAQSSSAKNFLHKYLSLHILVNEYTDPFQISLFLRDLSTIRGNVKSCWYQVLNQCFFTLLRFFHHQLCSRFRIGLHTSRFLGALASWSDFVAFHVYRIITCFCRRTSADIFIRHCVQSFENYKEVFS